MDAVDWLWAVGALAVGLYMVAALLRPDCF